MVLFLRDKDDNNIVDCEIYTTSGKVRVHLSVHKSWQHSVELAEFKTKCDTMDGVSASDDAQDTVINTLRNLLKKIAVKTNLRYQED